jgi:hypothetical protein
MAWHRSNPVERASGDHPWNRAHHRHRHGGDGRRAL